MLLTLPGVGGLWQYILWQFLSDDISFSPNNVKSHRNAASPAYYILGRYPICSRLSFLPPMRPSLWLWELLRCEWHRRSELCADEPFNNVFGTSVGTNILRGAMYSNEIWIRPCTLIHVGICVGTVVAQSARWLCYGLHNRQNVVRFLAGTM